MIGARARYVPGTPGAYAVILNGPGGRVACDFGAPHPEIVVRGPDHDFFATTLDAPLVNGKVAPDLLQIYEGAVAALLADASQEVAAVHLEGVHILSGGINDESLCTHLARAPRG